jgi:putative transposase
VSTIDGHGRVGLVRPLCDSVGVAPATYYRARQTPVVGPRPAPPRTLSPDERQQVLAVLHEPRFIDCAPAQVYATLLDEGTYLCAERTMYRVLAEHVEVKERRAQRRHAVYAKPELLATGPNQLWSWDITKLRGPQPGTWYHLYVVLDVFSRYIVGWLVAPRESAALATALIETCCRREGIARDQLTVHADRGKAMLSRSLTQLLVELGVAKTHSRPHVSNDNPYSEAQFRTLKYRPDFPARFGSLEDARAFLIDFCRWYNAEHRHSGLGLHTPYDVHTGRAATRQVARQQVLTAAYAAHPERFVRRPPTPAALPTAVWINPPPPTAATVALQ